MSEEVPERFSSPCSVPLSHFHFASVSCIWLFLLVLIIWGGEVGGCVTCVAVLCSVSVVISSDLVVDGILPRGA